jgi:hypothetical protein
LNILVLSSSPDAATVKALGVCLGISIFHWTIGHSETQSNPADIPAILYFPVLKQFGITIKRFPLADGGESFPLINAPVVQSFRLTSPPYWEIPEFNPRKIIDSILKFDTHFLSYLHLEGVDFSEEQFSILLLGHPFPALRHLTLHFSILTSPILLSLMSCGSLYDAALDYRPLLEQVSCNNCNLIAHLIVLSSPDLPQPMISFSTMGIIYSCTLQDIDKSLNCLCITSTHKKESLDLGLVDNLEKLTELYGICCKWPSPGYSWNPWTLVGNDSHMTGQT